MKSVVKPAMPGPWHTEILGREPHYRYLIVVADKGVNWGGREWSQVAEVHGLDFGADCEFDGMKTASLVAAAPELRDTLDLLVRTVQDTLRHGLSGGQTEALKDMVRISRDVLEKAERAEPDMIR